MACSKKKAGSPGEVKKSPPGSEPIVKCAAPWVPLMPYTMSWKVPIVFGLVISAAIWAVVVYRVAR
jgi:hypothetical protein